MKTIQLRKGEKLSSKDILRQVTELSPHRPITVDEMRKRVRVLDAIDNCDGDFLVLEDSDHEVLQEALKSFPWSQANSALLQIIDDVIDARTTPASVLKKVQ